jgi:hypothetical protein
MSDRTEISLLEGICQIFLNDRIEFFSEFLSSSTIRDRFSFKKVSTRGNDRLFGGSRFLTSA